MKRKTTAQNKGCKDTTNFNTDIVFEGYKGFGDCECEKSPSGSWIEVYWCKGVNQWC